MSGDATVVAERSGQFATAADGAANTLRTWLHVFWKHSSPRWIAVCLLAAVGARIAVGGYRRLDIVVALAFVVAQPITEWVIHVFILHFRVRHIGKRTIDLYIARKHRAHHVDPGDIQLTFVAPWALATLIVGVPLVSLVGFRDVHLAATATLTGYVLLAIYEWMHFLIHSTYVPRSRIYKTIWRAHRLHHFKNEHYWFGVTNPLGDIVLRTYPNRSNVATSHTARNIGAS